MVNIDDGGNGQALGALLALHQQEQGAQRHEAPKDTSFSTVSMGLRMTDTSSGADSLPFERRSVRGQGIIRSGPHQNSEKARVVFQEGRSASMDVPGDSSRKPKAQAQGSRPASDEPASGRLAPPNGKLERDRPSFAEEPEEPEAAYGTPSAGSPLSTSPQESVHHPQPKARGAANRDARNLPQLGSDSERSSFEGGPDASSRGTPDMWRMLGAGGAGGIGGQRGAGGGSSGSDHPPPAPAPPPRRQLQPAAREDGRQPPSAWQKRYHSLLQKQREGGAPGMVGMGAVPSNTTNTSNDSERASLIDRVKGVRNPVQSLKRFYHKHSAPLEAEDLAQAQTTEMVPRVPTSDSQDGKSQVNLPILRGMKHMTMTATERDLVEDDEDFLQVEDDNGDVFEGLQAHGGFYSEEDMLERPSMTVEKARVEEREIEELLIFSRQRKNSMQSFVEESARLTGTGTDERLAQRYAMLSDMVNLINCQIDPERRGQSSMKELMTSLRFYTQEMISCDRSSLFIKVKHGDKWHLWTMLETGQEISVPLLSGLVGACICSRGPIRVDDVKKDPRWNSEVDKFTGYKTKSVMCVPVFTGSEHDGKDKQSFGFCGDSGHETPSVRGSAGSGLGSNLGSGAGSVGSPMHHEDILGVIQVINKIEVPDGIYRKESRVGLPFNAGDMTILKSLATMSAITLQVHKALESERRAKDRFAALGSMAKMLLRQSTADVQSLYRHIQSEAARLCHCELAYIYMLDASKTFLQVESEPGKQQNLRLPPMWAGSGTGSSGMNFIAGHAMRTGRTVNVIDVSKDPRWTRCVEQRRLGIEELKSVVAVPISRENASGQEEIIGVLQAVNKTDAKGRTVEFDVEDLALLEGLCGYTSSALATSLAFKATSASYEANVALVPQEELNRVDRSLKATSSRSSSELPDFSKEPQCTTEILADSGALEGSDIMDWSFDPTMKEDDDLSSLIVPVFSAFDLQRDFRIDDSTLAVFAQEVANGYYKNPFHSYQHAWSVLQASTHMLFTLGAVANDVLCKVDILALLVGAICHDVGHPGTNNMFQQKVCSPIALLYNDVSILENHHSATCFRIMMEYPEANVLANLSKKDFQLARRFICHAILCTDMSRHERELTLLRAHTGTPLTKDSEEDRQLTVSSVLHSADLSNPCREPHLAEKWARLLAEEFKEQTVKEQEAGIEVSAFMLGGYKESNEIFFVNTFVKPLWETMSSVLPPLKIYLDALNHNFELLQQRVAKKKELEDLPEAPVEDRKTFHPGDKRRAQSKLKILSPSAKAELDKRRLMEEIEKIDAIKGAVDGDGSEASRPSFDSGNDDHLAGLAAGPGPPDDDARVTR